jgi:hypothetical protein
VVDTVVEDEVWIAVRMVADKKVDMRALQAQRKDRLNHDVEVVAVDRGRVVVEDGDVEAVSVVADTDVHTDTENVSVREA